MGEPARRVGVEQYLALDAGSDAKHEYLNGVVVAMAGGSPRHNLIAANLTGALGALLADTPCRVFGSDQRVRIAESGGYVYPDLSVVCDEPRFTDERPPSLDNPLVVVQVLSPSTEEHDRGTKLAHYRRLPSLQEILLVEPNERRVERYRRIESGEWLITDVTDGALDLASLGGRLAIDAVYAKTDGLPLDLPPDA